MSNPEKKNASQSCDDEKVDVSIENGSEKRRSGVVILHDFRINDSLIRLEGGMIDKDTGTTIYSQEGYFIYFTTTNNRFHVSMELYQLPVYPLIQTGEPFGPSFPVENLDICPLGEESYRINFDLYVNFFDETSELVSRNEFDVQVVDGDYYKVYLRVFLNAQISKS